MIDLIIQSVILTSSLAVLAAASHYTIRWVERIIAFTGLSEISVGFVVLSVLTSTPEITVALFSAVQGTPGISIGDILGSNVFNIAIVIGIIAMFGYLKNCCNDLLVELTDFLFLTSLIPLLLAVFGVASRFVGFALLVVFAINIYFMIRKRTPSVDNNHSKTRSRLLTVAMTVVGVAIVVTSARSAVSSASSIATALGAPPITIGAKIVAIGTSLPELALDLAAARKGRIQLAIGDIIGSNLTNLTLVLGLLLIASPFAVDIAIFTRILPFILITTLILWRYLTKGGVSQTGGLVLLMTYIMFQAVL